MSTTPREMNANFNGRCAVCHQGFPAGTRISYTPPHDGQRSRCVHLECVSRERPPLNDYQRSQIFEQSSPLPPRQPQTFEPFEDRNPLPQRLTEDAETEAIRREGEQRWREQERRRISEQVHADEARIRERRMCRACDDSGYQCEVCGNPGLENAPCNQPQKGTAPGEGRKGKQSAPEAEPARQSSEPVTSGFPRRPARARHIGEPRNRFAVKVDKAEEAPQGHPELPRGIDGRVMAFAWLDPAVCPRCVDRAGPSHTGSSMCRSGSLASGGLRAHCSCEGCF